MINFAQGELVMLGALVGFTLATTAGLAFGWVIVLTAIAMALFGYLLDALVLRRVLGEPQFVIVILTIGLGLVFRGVAAVLWGADSKNLPTPFSSQTFDLLGFAMPLKNAAILVGAAVLLLALWLFFSRTRIGVAMQGTSQNQLAAHLVGVPVKRVFSLVWAISAAVAGVAGILVAPVTLIDTNMGYIGLNAFAAAVIGGFGSLPGAVVGGIIVGVSQQLAALYLSEAARDAAPYVLMLLVLMVARDGLFGKVAGKKV
jgi:branched-chain amino acid transport system permease protein